LKITLFVIKVFQKVVNLCSKVREFKSQHHILDIIFFTIICCKKCNVFESKKINEKEAEVGPFLEKMYSKKPLSGLTVSDPYKVYIY